MPVYPIVIYSYARPRRKGPSTYRLRLAGREIVTFRFRVIQLNRLRWRDFLDRPNPVASALMARMDILPKDRPRVKAECLRMVASLRLDEGKSLTIGKFVDSYLQLDHDENRSYSEIVKSFEAEEGDRMAEYVTSWERRGMEIGRLEGRQEGRLAGRIETLQEQLAARFGDLSQGLQDRVAGCDDLDILKKMSELLINQAPLDDLDRLLP